MRRGSTPTNTFRLSIDLSQATVYIDYEQGGDIVIEKTGDDLTFGEDEQGYTITLELSQEDTLAFRSGSVDIQLRYVMPNGAADASNIVSTNVARIIKDGVIEHV